MIELKVKKTGLLPRLVLLALLIIMFISPILFISIFIYTGDFSAGMLLSLLIAWGTGYFIFRAYIWNVSGTEKIKLNNKSIYVEELTNYFKTNTSYKDISNFAFSN